MKEFDFGSGTFEVCIRQRQRYQVDTWMSKCEVRGEVWAKEQICYGIL